MKKFARVLSSGLLKLCLFNLALVTAVVVVLGNPAQLKKSLSESGIYDNFVQGVIKESTQASKEENDFPLDNPEIQAAITNALPPEFLQTNAESFIDGTYVWLNGETAKPAFTIDLSAAKQSLANGIGDYAQRRFAGLPVCTFAQLQELQSDVDPFSVPCQPPGMSTAMIRQQVTDEIAKADEFLPQTVITPDTLPKDEQGRTPFDQLSELPGLVSKLKLLPWVLGSLSILFTLGVVFWHETRRKGLRSVAVTLIGTGAFLIISTLLMSYLFGQMNKPGGSLGQLAQGEFQQSTIAVLRSLSAAINKLLLQISGGYVALGAITLLALHFTNPKIVPEVTQTTPATEVVESTPPETQQDDAVQTK